MHAELKLSTKVLTTQNAHQVGLLVTLEGERPVARAPINVALVLDRSGSMAGDPLDAARAAARRFATCLGPDDRLAVVAFDTEVETVFGPAAGGDPRALAAIDRLDARASTNLSGGWLEGRTHVGSARVAGVNRVVLFTDGQANQGVVDVERLTGMTAGAAAEGVSTSCIGFGPQFNEDLLQAMARAGAGHFWYVPRADQMTAMFEEEIEGLVSLAAQNVVVEVKLTHPGAAGLTLLQPYPSTRDADGTWQVRLGDLVATSPLALGVIVHVDDVAALGPVSLGQVRVRADVLHADGIEHRVTILPVTANLDGADHEEPVVERTFLKFRVAQARADAVRRADVGDLDGAAAALAGPVAELERHPDDAELARELAELKDEVVRVGQRKEWTVAERKSQLARSSSAMEMKQVYAEKLRRRGERR